MATTIKLSEKCCDKCWHTPAKPCSKLIACLTEGPLCHDDEACRAKKQMAVSILRKERLTIPTIFVGAGTCGLGAGAEKTIAAIKSYCSSKNIVVDIVTTGCIGMCSAEPIVDVQMPGRTRVSFQNITDNKVEGLLDGVFKGTPDKELALGQFPAKGLKEWDGIGDIGKHPFFAPQTRLVLRNCGVIDPTSLDEYLVRDGYKALASVVSGKTPEDVCSIIEKCGLRGRGGGGFPTGKKWRIALAQSSAQKYFVCNADEGDPGAFMDRAVIEGDPHRLLEGLAIASYAIGASKAYVYIRAEYPLAIRNLKIAIQQALEAGILGYNIFDSGFNLNIIIKQGAGAFVCGEETALIHSIEGKRGMPRLRPPYPAVSGVFGKPTVINNVETLANVPTILLEGEEAFARLGTANSKGTKVFALSGKVNRTGLVEIEMGKSIRDIVFSIGGGIPNNKKYKAVQIGGPSGGCISEGNLDIAVDYESLKQVGAMMGSGGLVVMDEDNCMVDVAKFFMEFIQKESCGKCIPCREGTRRMLEILKSITSRPTNGKTGTDALERFKGVTVLEDMAQVIRDTSLCGLGQTAPNPVLTTLRWFRDEYDAHVYDRKCPAGACVELLTYTIDEAACKGCTLCSKKCPTGAIKGAVKSPHYIVPEKCISCGTCLTVCKFGAVTRS